MNADGAEPIGVVHYGLGPIGLAVASIARTRATLRSIAAIDKDPALADATLGSMLDVAADGGPVIEAGYRHVEGAHVVLHCTGSRLRAVHPQLLECVADGLDVISSCEELSYPWDAHADLAAELDAAAIRHGVTVLGTGINPGYAMDYLPVVLSAAAKRVDHVRVVRRQDASNRRLPLQRKVGAGLDQATFRRRADAGDLGHVGLRESAQAIGAALAWSLSSIEESIEPVCAERTTETPLGEIEAGMVLGLRHRVLAYRGDAEVVSLELQMALGLGTSIDEIDIAGDPDVRLVVPGGLHGDSATASIMVNAIPVVMAARPGLAVMTDLAPPRPAASAT